jgi:hypothetical protein
VTDAGSTVGLDAEQAANATTIAAVGKRLGLPDHAVTIALATALQESDLHNLNGGDLDSLGLFQQRPSQGWGPPAQIMSPPLAAASFYRRLASVPGWATMPVTRAAQAVQRSAFPDGYANWETPSRLLAKALTGQSPATFSCRVDRHRPFAPTTLATAMTRDLGTSQLDSPRAPQLGWTLPTWLVAHAERYGITSIAFDGYLWSTHQPIWRLHPPARPIVRIAG